MVEGFEVGDKVKLMSGISNLIKSGTIKSMYYQSSNDGSKPKHLCLELHNLKLNNGKHYSAKAYTIRANRVEPIIKETTYSLWDY